MVISSSSGHHSIRDVFWKLVFVTPVRNKLNISDADIVDWLCHKLCCERTGDSSPPSLSGPDSQLLSLSTTPLLPSSGHVHSYRGVSESKASARPVASQQGQLCLVVRGLCDETLLTKDAKDLRGTCAVAVFLPTQPRSAEVGPDAVVWVIFHFY